MDTEQSAAAVAREIVADLIEGREPSPKQIELLRQATSALPKREYDRQRRELGIAALHGSARVAVNGRNLGVEFMRVRFGERDAKILACVMKLSEAMKVVYRDYDFRTFVHLLIRFAAWRNAGNLNSFSEEEVSELRSTEKKLYRIVSAIAKSASTDADIQLQLIRDTDNAFRINSEFVEQKFLEVTPEDLMVLREEFRKTWEQVRAMPFSAAEEASRTMLLLWEEIREAAAMVGKSPDSPLLEGEVMAQAGGRIVAAKRMIDDEVSNPAVEQEINKLLEEADRLSKMGG